MDYKQGGLLEYGLLSRWTIRVSTINRVDY